MNDTNQILGQNPVYPQPTQSSYPTYPPQNNVATPYTPPANQFPPAHPTAPYVPPGAPGYQASQSYQPPVDPTHPKKIPDRKSVATKMIELTYLLLIIVESVLALRFLFKLLGASSENVFIQFLYQSTEVFTFAFQGLFGRDIQNSIRVANYDLEFTTLVAMGVYALIAYIVVRIIDIFR